MTTKISGLSLKTLTFIIILINIPAGLGVDGHSPSLPAMAHLFHVQSGYVQATIAIYLLGFAIASLFIGFLTESKGRLWGIKTCAPLYALGTLMAIFAPTVTLLLLGRFIQGMGASGFGIMGGILLNEATPDQEKDRLGAYFSMSYALIPILAPVIGGYIQHLLGWQYNFGLMLLFCLIVVTSVLIFLPETCQTIGKKPVELKKILLEITNTLKNFTFFRFALVNGSLWGIIPIYTTVAPFVLQNQLKLNAIQFGHLTMFVGLGCFLGSSVPAKLPKNWTSHQKILPAKIILPIIPCLNLLIYYTIGLTPTTFMIPVVLQTVVSSYLYTLAYVQGVNVFKKNIGLASALMGTITCIFVPVLSYVILFFHITTAIYFDYLLLTLALLSLALLPRVPGHPKG